MVRWYLNSRFGADGLARVASGAGVNVRSKMWTRPMKLMVPFVLNPRSGRPHMVPLYCLPVFLHFLTAMDDPMLMVSPYWSLASAFTKPNPARLSYVYGFPL